MPGPSPAEQTRFPCPLAHRPWHTSCCSGSGIQRRLHQAGFLTLRRTCVPPAFFFDDYDQQQRTGLQVELLALVRGTGATSAQLRALLELSPQARQAIADLVAHTTRAETERIREQERSETG